MAKTNPQSAGILAFRFNNKNPEFFLVHPGGPFWKNKDEGAWSIPKGEFDETENALDAAKREFFEETAIQIDWQDISFIPLNPIKLKSGKIVVAFAYETDFDASSISSNNFMIEWPPKSGKMIEIPEVDRGEWFDTDTVRLKANPAQEALIEELFILISSNNYFGKFSL